LAARTANTVTFVANPGWAVNHLAPVAGRYQYILIVKQDASTSPGVAGDWWHIQSNTDKTVTVDAAGDDLVAHLAAGDTLEVRRLTSVKDLFGSGSSCVLNKDSNGEILTTEEDVITLVQGTSFVGNIFYHDGSVGPEGYYDPNGNEAGDGSTLTLDPGQPVLVFRRSGSPTTTIPFVGHAHSGPFTQYLSSGPNAIGPVFPVPAPIGTSKLKESGWVSDVNAEVLTTEESLGILMNGSFFSLQFFHYAGADFDNGWYVDGNLDNSYPFQPAAAYTVFHKGPNRIVWRQPSPIAQ
jgi:hypothetical protein